MRFGCFTFSPAVPASHMSLALAVVCVFWGWFGFVVCFGVWCLVSPCFLIFVLQVPETFLTSFSRDTALDDRQCFYARSASR